MLGVKVDEDLPIEVVAAIRSRGHDVLHVRDQGMGGWTDEALWRAVQAEQRLLVTADKGFGDVRAYPPGTHAGVLLLRPDEDGIRPLVALMESVLGSCDLELLTGTVAVATDRGLRIRRPV